MNMHSYLGVFYSLQCLTPAPLPPLSQLPTVQEHVTESRKKMSLSRFKPSTTIKPYPNYKPRPAWVFRPPSTVSPLGL